MQIKYITQDEKVGAAYVAVGPKTEEERKGIVKVSEEVHPGVVLDFDAAGELVGVELY